MRTRPLLSLGRNLSSLYRGVPRHIRKLDSNFLSLSSIADEGDLEHAKFGQFIDSNMGDGSNRSALKFVERVQIEVKGGRGGNGCISHEVLSPGKKRPDGGNGGKGGNVFIVGSSQVESLQFSTYHFNAGNGTHGSSSGMTGRKGKDVYIHVPLGTVITEHIPEDYSEYFYFDDGDPSDIAKARGKDVVTPVAAGGQEDREDNEEGKAYDDRALQAPLEDERLEETDSAISPGTEGDCGGSWALDEKLDASVCVSPDGQSMLDSDVDRASSAKKGRKKKNRRRERRKHSKEMYEDEEEDDLLPALRREVLVDGETYLVASGGDQGIGNKVLAGSSRHVARSLPVARTPGRPGMQRSLIMELKLIADVGLVGFPNAGKSTLLRQVSNAKPRVAPYHFTTLRPYLGVMHYNDQGRVTFADIPGLVEGAHANRGLGHTFLRHIERTKVLLYVLDGAGTEGRDPGDDLKHLMDELRRYNPALMEKPALVLANKVDLRGLFYRDRDATGAVTGGNLALHDDIEIDMDIGGGSVDAQERTGSCEDDVYRGIEDRPTYGEMSNLETVAAEAGLTIIDGSADTGEGIAKLAMFIKAKIQESEANKEEGEEVSNIE